MHLWHVFEAFGDLNSMLCNEAMMISRISERRYRDRWKATRERRDFIGSAYGWVVTAIPIRRAAGLYTCRVTGF